MSARTWPALLGLALGLSLQTARADDLLEQIKRNQQVKAQQIVADVKALLDQAKQEAITDARRARDLLLKARGLMDDVNGLDETTRKTWLRQIQVRLQDIQALIREQDASAKAVADKQAALERQREKDRQDKIKSGVMQADDSIKQVNKILAAYSDLRKKKEQAILAGTLEIYESATRMTEERITKRFIESAKRKEAHLTKEEKELLKMLNSTLSVDFNKTPFKDALEHIQDKTGDPPKLRIFIDEGSLKEAGVEYDSPVTFKQKSLTVRTILRKILADRGLTYIVKDAALQVMTFEKAKSIMISRTYPIQDLVGVLDMRWGPVAARAQLIQNVNQLIGMIVTSIEPNSWRINNPEAGGTITFHEPSMSLIIRNSAEMHNQLPGGINW
jgi:hypothetical protein